MLHVYIYIYIPRLFRNAARLDMIIAFEEKRLRTYVERVVTEQLDASQPRYKGAKPNARTKQPGRKKPGWATLEGRVGEERTLMKPSAGQKKGKGWRRKERERMAIEPS